MLLLITVALLLTQQSTAQQPTHANDDDSTLTCRITTQDTLFEVAGRVQGQQEIVCAPHRSQRAQEENLYAVNLPSWLLPKVETGRLLFVNVTGATLDNQTEQVVLSASSQFTVVPEPDTSRRRLWLKKDYQDAFGVRTYAIILVSTADATPSVTAERMRARFTNPDVGMQAQYKACSANKLEWQLQGVHQVTLTGRLADFDNSASTIRNEATEKFLERTGLESMEDLANNVLFCLPPGVSIFCRHGRVPLLLLYLRISHILSSSSWNAADGGLGRQCWDRLLAVPIQ